MFYTPPHVITSTSSIARCFQQYLYSYDDFYAKSSFPLLAKTSGKIEIVQCELITCIYL